MKTIVLVRFQQRNEHEYILKLHQLCTLGEICVMCRYHFGKKYVNA